ncbi:hypothetical protein GCM10007874_18680 [Labrys miyagiensis]|uniref:Uncharacterized protein n=1 Tax=Labrys miyagiensis TaxID=346912 RepID=A0ABQ6CEU7_9HYPH|nr:hypothetical protein [Labrys miyagiensis]GLS18851.1 hypothetical protein GCM10007874_18680 [Labrys miyagiensis]
MRFLRLLCLASGLIVPAAGFAAPASVQDDQITLTGPIVENFIAAHGELSTLAAQLTRKYGDRSETPGDDPVASLPAFDNVPEAKAQTQALLAKFHYKDFDELEIVTNSVMLAYQADVPDSGDDQATPDGSKVDLDADKAKAKAEVEADTSLTPDKKKEALQQIEDQYASLQDSTPLPGNAEAVKPYLDKLKPIAESN